MKFLIFIGFLIGFGGVLTAAGLVPIGAQQRLASRTSVANNGGRLERFVIRLPADRIVSAGGAPGGLPGVDPAARIEPPAALAGADFTVEQFKLRNVAGDVIGVAMRHTTTADAQGTVTWAVSLPGRGSLVWSSAVSAGATLANALAAGGVQPGTAWQGELGVAIAAGERAGSVVTGTEEFAGNAGRVEEVWEITGVGGNGEIRGTIVLDTVVNQSS